jgi:hypothetical protein
MESWELEASALDWCVHRHDLITVLVNCRAGLGIKQAAKPFMGLKSMVEI